MSLRKLVGIALAVVTYSAFLYWQGSQSVEAVNACKGSHSEQCQNINNLGM